MKLSDIQSPTPTPTKLSDVLSTSETPVSTVSIPETSLKLSDVSAPSKGFELPGWLGDYQKKATGQKGFVTVKEANEFESKNNPRMFAAGESVNQGLLGITPSRPDLQQKYPVQSFATGAVSSIPPYLIPGAAPLKFGAISGMHEIIRQATSPEELSPTQMVLKVGTSAGFGASLGWLFNNPVISKAIVAKVGDKLSGGVKTLSDLNIQALKESTVIERIANRSLGGGVTSAVESLVQDIESGREPELKSALYNGALNMATIGLLGAAFEMPQLKAAVIEEGSRWLGRPATYAESKAVLKSGGVNPESLSPDLKNAVYETKRQAALSGIKKTANDLGVSSQSVSQVYRARSVQERLALIDDQVYGIVKKATGRTPSKTAEGEYTWDYSQMNPMTAEKVQVLLKFREQIAQGADPVDVLWNYEVGKRLKTKEYIQAVLKEKVKNYREEFKIYQQNQEPPKLKPTEYFAKGFKETASSEGLTKVPVAKPSNEQVMTYLPEINRVLANVRQSEEEKPEGTRRVIPNAENLDPGYLREIVQEMGKKMESGENIESFLTKKFLHDDTDPKIELYVQTTHEGKEDDPNDSRLFNTRTLRTETIGEVATLIKNYNVSRKAAGLPAIDIKKDVIIHRNALDKQPEGIALKVRKGIISEYENPKKFVVQANIPPAVDIAYTSPEPTLPTPPSTPTGAVPVEQAAQQAAVKMQENLAPGGESAVSDIPVPEAPSPATEQSTVQLKLSDVTTTPEPISAPVPEKPTPLDIIMDGSNIHMVNEKAVELEQKLGRIPTPEELAQSLGCTVQDIRDIRNTVNNLAIENHDNYVTKSEEDLESEFGTSYRDDLPAGISTTADPQTVELAVIRDIVEELYESMSTKKYDEKIYDLQKRREPKKTSRKIIFKSLFLKTYKGKTKDDIEKELINARWGFSPSEQRDYGYFYIQEVPFGPHIKVEKIGDKYFTRDTNQEVQEHQVQWRPDEEVREYINKKIYQDVAEQIKNIQEQADKLKSQWPFLINSFKKDLAVALERVHPQTVVAVSDIVNTINENSTEEQVLSVVHSIREMIRDAENAGYKLSEAELTGGVTFSTKGDPVEIKTFEGPITLAPETEYDWYLSEDRSKYIMSYGGKSVSIPLTELTRLLQITAIDVSYDRYVDEKQDLPFEGENEVWGNEKGSIGPLRSIKVLRHTPPERICPTPLILRWMRSNPWVYNLTKHWKTKHALKKDKESLRRYFTVDPKLHDPLWDYVIYEDAVTSISREDLQPILDDVLMNVKNHMKEMGIKGESKKEVYQPRLDAISELMHKASSQILMNSYDPNNYAWSLMGNGPHLNEEEREAYVAEVNRIYDMFDIPPADRMPDGDPKNIVPGTLRYSRTPVYWNLLVHPNVMNNDSLQRAIRFYKAQIENFILDELVKNGMYANADMVSNVLNGYTKSAYEEKGTQAKSSGNYKNNPLQGPEGKEREIRTPEVFSQRMRTKGLTPVDDFFTASLDYMQEGYRNIKQLQLLEQFKKIELRALEYESEEFVQALKDHPAVDEKGRPVKFYWVQHSTDENIVKEALRMSKILGREVTAQEILTEGGWVKGHEKGLVTWYKGKFVPPYIYFSLAEETKSMLEPGPDLGFIEKLAMSAQIAKWMVLSNPADSVEQYISNIAVDRPAAKIIPYYLAIPARKVFHLIKGVTSTGPKIAKGTYAPVGFGKDDYEQRVARLLQEKGLVAAQGYKAFMASMFDKADSGKFPQRQNALDDFNDYKWSVFGAGEQIFHNFIEKDITAAGIAMVEQKVSEGMDIDPAAIYVAHYLNNTTFMLHRKSFDSKLGFVLRAITTSRSMAVAPLRILFLMAQAAGAGKGKQIYRTKGGTGGGEWLNVVLGSDVPQRFMPSMGWKIASLMAKVFAIQILARFIFQSALQSMETGELSGPWDNPDNAKHLIKLPGWTNVNGDQLYLDLGTDKMQRNIVDIMSTFIDPMLHLNPEWKDVHTGKGIGQFVLSKLGVITTLMELMPWNEETYNRDEGISWDNAKRFVEKSADLLPLNPWGGSGKVEVDLSTDPLLNNLLKSFSLLGYSIKPVKSQERQDMERKVRTVQWHQKDIDRKIRTEEQAREAQAQGLITPKQMIGQFPKSDAQYRIKNRAAIRMFNQKYSE